MYNDDREPRRSSERIPASKIRSVATDQSALPSVGLRAYKSKQTFVLRLYRQVASSFDFSPTVAQNHLAFLRASNICRELYKMRIVN